MTTSLPVNSAASPRTAAPAGENRRALSPRDVGTILCRHKKKAILFLLATVSAAALLASRRTATYTAEALLLVKRGRDSVSLDPTAATGEVYPVHKDWENALNSELAILNSSALADAVVARMGVDRFLSPVPQSTPPTRGVRQQLRARLPFVARDETPPTPDERHALASRWLSRALEIEVIPKSDVLRLRCSLADPETARDALTALIDLYGDMHIHAHRTAGSLAFFSKQAETLYRELQLTEAELITRKNTMGTANPETQKAAASERVASLRKQQDAVELELETTGARRDAMVKRKEALAATTRSVHPGDMRELKSSLQDLEMEMKALARARDTLASQYAEALAEVTLLNTHASELSELERKAQLLEKKYRKYAAHMEQARISDALEDEEISSVTVFQPPTLPEYANDPGRASILFVALLLGGVGALGVVLVAEHLDQSVRTPADVEDALHVRLLASIPLLRPRTLRPRRRGRRSSLPRSNLPDTFRPPQHVAAAPFAQVACRVLAAFEGQPAPRPILIGVTGCNQGAGASTVATQLSVALARLRSALGRILLIEPHATRSDGLCFGPQTEAPRASEFVMTPEGDVIVREQNIYALHRDEQDPADPECSRPEPSHLPMPLDALALRARAANADVAVFDLPPVLNSSAAERFAPLMDGIVLVAESENTRRQSLQRAYELLVGNGVELLGAVLNKRRYYMPGWLYNRL